MGTAIPGQMGLGCVREVTEKQASKQHFPTVSSSSFYHEFLPWHPSITDYDM